MQGAKDDLRFAWRSLGSQRGLTAAAVLNLALGIAGSTVAFVFMRLALVEQPAAAEPERVARVWRVDPLLGMERGGVSVAQFLALRTQIRSLEVAAFMSEVRTVALASTSPRVNVQHVSERFLAVLGTHPELGRFLGDSPGENGLVMSHELWRRSFDGDPAVIGRLFEVEGEEFPIVGVMPSGFGFPMGGTDLWMRLATTPGTTELQYQAPVGAPQHLIVASAPRAGPTGRQASAWDWLDSVRALPGVQYAAAADGSAAAERATSGVLADGATPQSVMAVHTLRMTAEGLRTLDLRVGRGRGFSPGDRGALAVVSARVARRLWPDEDPLGHQVSLVGQGGRTETFFDVVGVLADAAAAVPLEEFAAPCVYLLDDGSSANLRYLFVRTAIPASALLPGVRSAMAPRTGDDPWDIETFAQFTQRRLQEPWSMAAFIAAFGALALVLAGIGVHGVVRQAVRQRFHEIGVRMALGASRESIARLVLRPGLMLIGVGIAVGGLLAIATTRIAWSVIVTTSSADPWTLLVVAVPLAPWQALGRVTDLCEKPLGWTPLPSSGRSERASRILWPPIRTRVRFPLTCPGPEAQH